MKHSPLILHIPHASTTIPLYNGYVNLTLLQQEINLLTDWHTDQLFVYPGSERVVASFSRVFCDVERFRNDAEEPMASKGMSLTYTHTDSGHLLRNVSDELRLQIVQSYYDPHHEKLTHIVEAHLEIYNKARIIDCHSYPTVPLKRDLDQKQPRPDFNIGITPFHTPQRWIELSETFFSKSGYTLGVNWPYAGTMVPMKYYQKDARVESIMLEVNRDLYLEQGSNLPSANFDNIRRIITEWMQII